MNDDAESKLAAPKLFGRKKAAATTPPVDAPPTPPAPAPAPEPAPAPVVAPPVAEAAVETPVEAPADTPVEAPAEAPVEAPRAAKPAKTPKPAKAPKAAKRPRKAPVLPRLNGMQLAGIAGIVVGLFLVLATYGSLHLCATVRGANTCGGKAGFPLLLAIGILAVMGGGVLLRLGAVRSPMGDSFLAVALVAVITVLFLADHYEAWWMIIVVPVLSLGAYLLAHWVSVTYIDPVDEEAGTE